MTFSGGAAPAWARDPQPGGNSAGSIPRARGPHQTESLGFWDRAGTQPPTLSSNGTKAPMAVSSRDCLLNPEEQGDAAHATPSVR